MYHNNISFVKARKVLEQRKEAATQCSYAGAVGGSPKEDVCSTCKIVARILFPKFSDVEQELKTILPPSTFSKLVPNPATTPKVAKTPSQLNLPKPEKEPIRST